MIIYNLHNIFAGNGIESWSYEKLKKGKGKSNEKYFDSLMILWIWPQRLSHE